MSYKYEVFISYPRTEPSKGWVKEFFLPALLQNLKGHLPIDSTCEIFVDYRELLPGGTYPKELKAGLDSSRCLVPVFSPDYFRSEWCRAELDCMMERERLFSMRTDASPMGLILPVRFFDGDLYPQNVRHITSVDLTPWNYPGEAKAFLDSAAYLDFWKKVQEFSSHLAARIVQIPAWQATFPKIELKHLSPQKPHFTPPRMA